MCMRVCVCVCMCVCVCVYVCVRALLYVLMGDVMACQVRMIWGPPVGCICIKHSAAV